MRYPLPDTTPGIRPLPKRFTSCVVRSLLTAFGVCLTVNTLWADEPIEPVLAVTAYVHEGVSPVRQVAESPLDSERFCDFRIDGGISAESFRIDDQTGRIYLAKNARLDFEVQSQYQLLISAIRRGTSWLPLAEDGPESDTAATLESDFMQSLIDSGVDTTAVQRLRDERLRATISIQVKDVNEPPLVFPLSLRTHAPSGTIRLLGRIAAVDPDFGDSLNFRILTGNDDERFHIDSDTGELSLSALHESDTDHDHDRALRILVTDSMGAQSIAEANIEISTPIAPENVDKIETMSQIASATPAEQEGDAHTTTETDDSKESEPETSLPNEIATIKSTQVTDAAIAAPALTSAVVDVSKTKNHSQLLFLFTAGLCGALGFVIMNRVGAERRVSNADLDVQQPRYQTTDSLVEHRTFENEIDDETLLELFLTAELTVREDNVAESIAVSSTTAAVAERSADTKPTHAASYQAVLADEAIQFEQHDNPVSERRPENDPRQMLHNTSMLFRDISRQAATDAVFLATLHRSMARKVRIAVLSSLTAASLAVTVCSLLGIAEWNWLSQSLVIATLVSAAEHRYFVSRWKAQTQQGMSTGSISQ